MMRLSNESRLPRWFKNTSGVPDKNLFVEIRLYESGKVRVRISTSEFFGKTLGEGIGTYRWHPDSMKSVQPAGTFPNWNIFTINGVDEVYEQSGMNNLLRIVDKPVPK